MIRTLIAVAALAAVPSFAGAQPSAYDPNLTVLGHGPDSYSITIDVTGKSPLQVSREIWDAAYTACERLPASSNRADYTVEAMQTCVAQAQWNAAVQYRMILDQGRPYNVAYSYYDER